MHGITIRTHSILMSGQGVIVMFLWTFEFDLWLIESSNPPQNSIFKLLYFEVII